MLVTGGTGAFGQAFVARMIKLGHSRICIYSRDEYKQHLMRERFDNNPQLRFFVGDVRDRGRLKRAMRGVSTVIHAAALKRIEVGRYNTSEMVKTNIDGTMNVIEASQDVPSVRRVVYLSTDKAYQPCSGYGYSKAMGEALMLSANEQVGPSGPVYVSTRYGNVAGSTGSVIPVWRQALEEGKRCRMTDPGCTRYWMRMGEAVDLVMDATIERDKKLLVPTLPAYRLGDLAAVMGVDDPELIDLPPWEKMHESMDGSDTSETARRMTQEDLRNELKMLE